MQSDALAGGEISMLRKYRVLHLSAAHEPTL